MTILLPLVIPEHQRYISAPAEFTGAFSMADASLPSWISPNMLAFDFDFTYTNIGIYGTAAGVVVANAVVNDEVRAPSPDSQVSDLYIGTSKNYSQIDVLAAGGGSLQSADSSKFIGLGIFSLRFHHLQLGYIDIIDSSYNFPIPFTEIPSFSAAIYGDAVVNCQVVTCLPTPCSCSSNSTMLRITGKSTSPSVEIQSNLPANTPSLLLAGQWRFYVQVDSASTPRHLTVKTFRCSSFLPLPSRAPYPIEINQVLTNITSAKCTVNTYDLTVEIIHMESKRSTSSNLLPLAFYTNHPNLTTEAYPTISMNDPRAYGIKSPQIYPIKNVFPLIVAMVFICALLVVFYTFFEDPSWVLVKGLLAVGANGKPVKSPKGNEVLLKGIEYIGDRGRDEAEAITWNGIDYPINDESDLKQFFNMVRMEMVENRVAEDIKVIQIGENHEVNCIYLLRCD